MLKRFIVLVSIFFLSFSLNLGAAPKTTLPKKNKPFAQRRVVQQFIWEMHLAHKIDIQDIHKIIKGLDTDEKVLSLISKPVEALPWHLYEEKLVTQDRIDQGAAFYKQYEKELRMAENNFGTPPEIVVAIIGVESRYGKRMGDFSVLRTLLTLAFDYEKRAKFFRKELEEFILLTRETGLDATAMKGSYAGAIGAGQFMPSSYRRYAVHLSEDVSNEKAPDLTHNMSDVIASVANYLKENGWKRNEAVAYSAVGFGSEYQRLANITDSNPQPKLSLKQYAEFNILPKDKKVLKDQGHQLAAFLLLKDAKDEPISWLTLQNFYVITRYNRSVNYAMAVYEISQRIRAMGPQGSQLQVQS